MNLDINKKIEGIMQSNALDDLSLKFLPPVSDTPDNYYFISYSHKDYKAVYSDIYALQAEGVNVWYDRAMPAGESWKEIAEKYIRPSRCAGVVFYVSENSLLSPAIHEEIAFTKQCGKSCLTINLPTSDGKSHSAKEMLDAMIAKGEKITEEKYAFISDAFNDDVLFVPFSSASDIKAEKILKLEKPPIFEFKKKGTRVVLTAVKDIEIRKVTADQLAYYDEEAKITRKVNEIGKCAFANCALLESIDFPPSVNHIREYAFYGCKSLKSVDLSTLPFVSDYAFAFCDNLCQVDFSLKHTLTREIPKGAFYGCKSLKKVVLGDSVESVGEYAFAHSGCEELVIGRKVGHIECGAFSYCSQLHNITVDKENRKYIVKKDSVVEKENKRIVVGGQSGLIDDGVEIIGECAYEGAGIEKLVIPDSVKTIERHAFNCCEKLVEIRWGKNVQKVQRNAFYNCTALDALIVTDMAQWCNIDFESSTLDDLDFGIKNGMTYSSNAGANPLTSAKNLYDDDGLIVRLFIPNGVTRIKDGTFRQCLSISSVVLPPSIEEIGEEAFESCIKLIEIVNASNCHLPEAFDYVWRICTPETDDINPRLYSFEDCVFYEDDETNYLVGFTKLKEDVVLPRQYRDGEYVLHESLFVWNYTIKSLDIPNGISVEDVGLGTCKKLSSITVTGDDGEYASRDGILYSENFETILFVPPNYGDVLEVPSGVEEFDFNAIYSCEKLHKIILPVSVKVIKSSCDANIDTIVYQGTRSEWQEIETEEYCWTELAERVTIICSDGEITYSADWHEDEDWDIRAIVEKVELKNKRG